MTYLLMDWKHGQEADEAVIAFAERIHAKRVAIEASRVSPGHWLAAQLQKRGIKVYAIDSPFAKRKTARLDSPRSLAEAIRYDYQFVHIRNAATKIMVQRLDKLKRSGEFPDLISVGAGHAEAITKRFRLKPIHVNKKFIQSNLIYASWKSLLFFGNAARRARKTWKRLKKRMVSRRKCPPL